MLVTAIQAAKWLCEKSGWRLSNLESQKILYLAHLYHTGRNPETPLISDTFEAWDYGPVLPNLYHRVKSFGAEPVRNVFHEIDSIRDQKVISVLEEVYDSLKDATPSRLVSLTHRDNGAWATIYENGVRGKAIPNELIVKEYRDWINESRG